MITRRARAFVTRGLLAPGAHLSPGVRTVLALEILVTYAGTWRQVSKMDLRELVRRRPPEPAVPETLPTSFEEREVALRLANAVRRTLSVLPTDSRCLAQSLVVASLLSARGIPNQLVIGAHSAPEFTAHAWVEHDGRAVLPTQGFADSRLIAI